MFVAPPEGERVGLNLESAATPSSACVVNNHPLNPIFAKDITTFRKRAGTSFCARSATIDVRGHTAATLLRRGLWRSSVVFSARGEVDRRLTYASHWKRPRVREGLAVAICRLLLASNIGSANAPLARIFSNERMLRWNPRLFGRRDRVEVDVITTAALLPGDLRPSGHSVIAGAPRPCQRPRVAPGRM